MDPSSQKWTQVTLFEANIYAETVLEPTSPGSEFSSVHVFVSNHNLMRGGRKKTD